MIGAATLVAAVLASAAPFAPSTSLDPATPNFADRVTATATVVVDRGEVDPGSLRAVGGFGPLEVLAGPDVQRHDVGAGKTAVDFRWIVACLDEDCVPGDAPRTIALPPLRLSGTREDGSQATVVVRWPALAIAGRVSRAEAGKATPPFRRETGLPQASYRVSPDQLANVLDILAVVLVGAAGVIGARALLPHAAPSRARAARSPDPARARAALRTRVRGAPTVRPPSCPRPPRPRPRRDREHPRRSGVHARVVAARALSRPGRVGRRRRRARGRRGELDPAERRPRAPTRDRADRCAPHRARSAAPRARGRLGAPRRAGSCAHTAPSAARLDGDRRARSVRQRLAGHLCADRGDPLGSRGVQRPLRRRRLLRHRVRGASTRHACRGAEASRALLHAAGADDARVPPDVSGEPVVEDVQCRHQDLLRPRARATARARHAQAQTRRDPRLRSVR